MISVAYTKNRGSSLLKDLENPQFCNMDMTQRYIPIYERFLKLNNTNYNHVYLEQKHILHHIDRKLTSKTFSVSIQDTETDEIQPNVTMFCKYSPLADPVKFMIGKYSNGANLSVLPNLENSSTCHPLFQDKNNMSYVDGLFTYFSSKTLEYGFQHGVQYYGSFLGIKREFEFDITDDMEFVTEHPCFFEGLDKEYTINNKEYQENFQSQTAKNKTKLVFDESNDTGCIDVLDVEPVCVSTQKSMDDNTSNQCTSELVPLQEISGCILAEQADETLSLISDETSTCSSRVSITDDEDEDDEDDEDDEEDEVSSTEEQIMTTLFRYPIQTICMENCKETLGDYMSSNVIEVDEWRSILFQVVTILTVYQKVFAFTHNDLHTNNIMYVETNQKHLYYQFQNKVFKVPTFGKIYKLIDFGRAIFRFKGQIFCSNNFAKGEDADTQYNTEPFFDDSKPRIDPNMSFDLCRLGCSLFDYFIEELEFQDEIYDSNPMAEMVRDWCLDNKKRNILYKRNGDERYPDFKLYKMIARSVRGNVPKNVMNHKEFKTYIIYENIDICKNSSIDPKIIKQCMNIDSYQPMV